MLKHNSRVVAVVRLFGLGVLALAVLVGLTVSAQQQPQPAQPVTQIKIVPEKPTINDEITIELSGTFPDACAPDSAEAQVEENQVTIRASNVSEFCAEGETKWSLSVPVGKKLEAGPYRVLVLFGMSKEAPELLLGMARFDVVAATQGRSADQAGQAGLVPFTILPVVQTLVGSIPFVGGALAANNLNSSKSNLNRQNHPIPTTVGVPIGDVVSISNLNSSKSNLYRVVDFRVRGGLVIGKDNNETDRIMIEITEPDPILTVLVEQIELPDLAVNIRTNVRRYTEMEQVFCDVTVLTTASNLGKGPTGVVALANNLNSSKSNIQRYGMGSGEGATQVDVLIRLRPGMYPLEAEVQSLSLKETNTANNKARQVVRCR